MKQRVLLNDFKRMSADIGSELVDHVKSVIENGYYILGKEVELFEKNLASYWGLSWSVGCGNGMDAIEIGLRALGLQPGEKVLTTPLSAFATTLAIHKAGGIPVFVDVDDNGLLDLNIAESILKTNEDIRYMVPVHLFGYPMDLNKLLELKSKFNLKVVEDCAQAIGATYNQQTVGTAGNVAAVSFYPTKNLGAIGDGGALLGNDKKIFKVAQALRNYGQSSRYVHDVVGLNSRLDELQAALLDFQLTNRLEVYTQKRRLIAHIYRKGITNPLVKVPPINQLSNPVWHLFPVLVNQRKQFMEHLSDHCIDSAIHYPIIIPDQNACQSFSSLTFSSLEKSRLFTQKEVSIPIHPYMTHIEVEYVINVINSWKQN